MNNIQFDQNVHKRISPREAQIAKLASQGMGIKATAAQLGIARSTVQNHRASLFKKLSQPNMLGVVTALREAGII